MVQSGSASSILETLPPRPPTPPRETKSSDTKPSLLSRIFSMDFGSQTPPNQSPESSTESANRASEKSQKKVEWSPWTEYKEHPQTSDKQFTPTHQQLRHLPPSGDRKPKKSILKPYNGFNSVNIHSGHSGNDKLAAPHTYANLASMLESIVRQLAGEDRTSRIDAYVTLSASLKASENIPDPRSLKEKMGLLAQFIQRDMSLKTPAGNLDTTIVNHALVLLNILVWKQSIADTMSVDFCIYVVEHAINAFEDVSVSKEIVKALLYTIGTQSFSVKVMNPDRVGRIIQSLVRIEEHVKGRSIISLRLGVYRRLLKQAKVSMMSNLGWLETMFTDMCSSLKDIQVPAITFGFEASLELGTERQVSRAVMELFNMESNESTYADYYARKLSVMIRSKQDCASVPQIWSIVVLFFRYRPNQLAQWQFMKPWIQVLQECFNKSDHPLKAQANFAWNRLVFALHLDEATAAPMIKMLGQGLSGQLKRKLVGKHARETRSIILGSVRNLLYYAMRPNAPALQFDLYWDEYIEPLVGNILVRGDQDPETTKEDLISACEIIGAFFDTSPKPWRENRANEDGIMQANELPGIEPKWIRRNAHRVFLVLGPLVENCFWDFTMEGSPISISWKKFVACVVLAGIKEVKVSNDTMTSVACIFNLLFKIWQQGPKRSPAATGDADSFEANYSYIVNTTIEGLGVLPFTEKLLSIGPQETFAIVATPSQYPPKRLGEAKSPLHHLFGLMAQPPAGLKCDGDYATLIAEFLRPFFRSRTSQHSIVELLKDLSQLVPPRSPDSRSSIIVWQTLANACTIALEHNDEANNSGSGNHDQPLGAEYRHILRFLELGISLSPEVPLREWTSLFTCTAARVTRDAGDGGRSISLIEPLARTLSTKLVAADKWPSISYCPTVVSSASYPIEKHALEAAHRRLWGSSNSNSRTSSLDPFSHLYIYISQCLTNSYQTLETDQSREHVELLTTVVDLIRRCPVTYTANLLSNIQIGVGIWIKDDNLKFRGRSSSIIASSVATLWESICKEVRLIRPTDSDLLKTLEPLISSGLESKHQSTVSDTIALWSSTFACQSHLEYPSRVAESLLCLRSIADLHLPSFPANLLDELMSDGPAFLDSQDDGLPYLPMDFETSGLSKTRGRSSKLEASLPHSFPEVEIESPATSLRNRSYEGTPERFAQKTIKKELTPKLRHDDSQIQFAPIESSPLDSTMNDTQLLTDRQREIKQRQAETAAMFPDLRSSPQVQPKSALSKLPTIVSDSPQEKVSVVDKPTTPMIARADKAGFNDYVTSSPTPRRGQVDLTIDSDAIDPPSSPPERLDLTPISVSKLSFAASIVDEDELESTMWDVTSFPSATLPEAELTSTDLGPSAQIDHLFLDTPLQTILVEDSTESETNPRIPAVELNAAVKVLVNSSSGRSSFVEALSGPNQASEEVFVDALSTPTRDSKLVENTSGTKEQASRLPEPYVNLLPLPKDAEQNPLNCSNAEQESASSAVSFMDEDSLLRLITTFDSSLKPQEGRIALELEIGKEHPGEVLMTSDELDCITVEPKAAPANGFRQILGRKRTPSSITRRKQASPCKVKRSVSSATPETPLKTISEPDGFVYSASPQLAKTLQRKVKSLSPMFSSPLLAESKTLRNGNILPEQIEQTPRKRTRTSKKLQEQIPEPSKKRKIDDDEITTIVGSQDIDMTNVLALAPTKKRGRPRKIQPASFRSSPTANERVLSATGSASPPASTDFNAPMEQEGKLSVLTVMEHAGISQDAMHLPSDITGDTKYTQISENGDLDAQCADHDVNQYEAASSALVPHIPQSSLTPRSHLSGNVEGKVTEKTKGEGKVGKQVKPTEEDVIRRLANLLEAMRSVTFSREGARRMDDLYWDLRAELSAGEIRGRTPTDG